MRILHLQLSNQPITFALLRIVKTTPHAVLNLPICFLVWHALKILALDIGSLDKGPGVFDQLRVLLLLVVFLLVGLVILYLSVQERVDIIGVDLFALVPFIVFVLDLKEFEPSLLEWIILVLTLALFLSGGFDDTAITFALFGV